jgi:GGDEF domain-containing protein
MRITVTDQNNGSDSRPRPADLRDAAQALLPRLRLEDLLAYLGDDTFVVLLPDMPVSAAEELLNEWSENLTSAGSGRGSGGPTIHASVGVCENGAEGLLGDEESVRIAQAL